jgi:hypothetical protein
VVPDFEGFQPEYPFAIMNHHHVLVPYSKRSHNWVGMKAFERRKFMEKAFVIDVNCRKYPVIDVMRVKRSWNPLKWLTFLNPMDWSPLMNPFTWPSYLFCPDSFDWEIRVKYVYGPPIQLTFNEARAEIVELICSRKWYGQTGGNERHFRETRSQCKDMRDFLIGEYGVGFYGHWQMHFVPHRRKTR